MSDEIAEEVAPDQGLVNYFPPGAVAADFHNSDAFVRGLLGPVGSGKSSACCVEIVMRALKQKPWLLLN